MDAKRITSGIAMFLLACALLPALASAACPSGHTTNPDGTCTVTFNDPTIDGYASFLSTYSLSSSEAYIYIYYLNILGASLGRGFVEWDISSIPDTATINDVKFRYHGATHASDCNIRDLKTYRPSTSTAQNVYTDAGDGTIYADPTGFPVIGTNQEVDLGTSADADLRAQLAVNWFAIGTVLDSETTGAFNMIYSEEYGATPKPTLVVTYSMNSCNPPASGDWIINVSDNCSVSNQTITLTGKTIITGNSGNLTFYNTTLTTNDLKINATNFKAYFKTPFRVLIL